MLGSRGFPSPPRWCRMDACTRPRPKPSHLTEAIHVGRPGVLRHIANFSSLEMEPSGPLEIDGSSWDSGGLGNGPNLLLCSLAASRSARCSKNAAPLSRSIGNQDRIVARVRRGGHIRPGLAVFRPRCHSCHCRGQRCGRCRGNHQIVPLFRTRAALGSAVAR